MAKYYGGGTGGGGGAVTSFNGRTGAVVPTAGDYTSTQVTNSSAVAGATVTAALNTLNTAIAGLVTGVSSVFGRSGAVVSASGDYTSSQVTNASGVAGASTSDALNTLNAAIDLTGARVVSGPANTFLKGTGAGNTWSTLFTTPANPGDNGKVTIASAGDFSYLSGSATGNALTWSGTAWVAGNDFAAQNLTTAGGFVGNSSASFIRLGLAAGSGAGVASAASVGQIRGARGTAGFEIYVRNAGDTANSVVLSTDTATNLLTIGSTAVGGLSPLIVSPTAGSVTLRAGASTSQLQVTTGGVALSHATFTYGSSVALPTINQTLNSAANQTGIKLTLHAQACTGSGTCVGGDLDIGPGWGTTNSGLGRLFTGQTRVQKLGWNDTGLALYAGAPVAQATRVGQATNSTGVAAVNRTMSDVTTAGLADPAKVNLNFANLADNMWNLLETAIHNIGLTA